MLDVTPLPAFTDNYIWIIHQDDNHVVIVDPGDSQVVLQWLQQTGLVPTAILITHRHNDHTGGVSEITHNFDIPVYGPDSPRVPCVTHPVYEGDSLAIFDQHRMDIIETPGHTLDHICYHLTGLTTTSSQLFCGDTLFSVGCGRIFDGTAEQLHQSHKKLTALTSDTWLYGAHEYTRDNIRFALAVEPNNEDLQQYKNDIKSKIITLPTQLKQQLKINPFLRVDQSSVRESVGRHESEVLQSETETFVALRAWKDHF